MEEIKCRLGSNIADHYRMIAMKAKEDKKTYYFEGNGIIFIADKDSDENLADIYLETAYEYDLKVIGPQPPMMTEEYKHNKEEEKRIKREEYEERCRIEREREEDDKRCVEAIIENEQYKFAEGKETAYNEWYEKNKNDGYGKVCFDYASDLAKYLQAICPTGDYCKEDVDNAEHLIRHYGITGFQHSVVRSILKETWKFYKGEMFNF